MNFEFLSNLVKLFGKKCYYACAVFLIVIQFNKTLEEFFINNKKYFVVLWLFAIIAIIDILNICYLELKEFKSKKEHEKQKTKNFLNSIELVKLNHKNGIEILYFLFNSPFYGDENCKKFSSSSLTFVKDKQMFYYCGYEIFDVILQFENISIGDSKKILCKGDGIIKFDKNFYEFLKNYFQKNPLTIELCNF